MPTFAGIASALLAAVAAGYADGACNTTSECRSTQYAHMKATNRAPAVVNKEDLDRLPDMHNRDPEVPTPRKVLQQSKTFRAAAGLRSMSFWYVPLYCAGPFLSLRSNRYMAMWKRNNVQPRDTSNINKRNI
eukprot:819229-Amphidinium_carterae.1